MEKNFQKTSRNGKIKWSIKHCVFIEYEVRVGNQLISAQMTEMLMSWCSRVAYEGVAFIKTLERWDRHFGSKKKKIIINFSFLGSHHICFGRELQTASIISTSVVKFHVKWRKQTRPRK